MPTSDHARAPAYQRHGRPAGGQAGWRGWLWGALFCVLYPLAHAQWVQQQIALKPGWNAVFLAVDPSPRECDQLFHELPVESVWDWNPSTDPAQFVQDPATLIPGSPNWLTWFPPTHPLTSQSTLFILRDGRPYLVKLADNAPPVTWTVTGRPSLRPLVWRAGAVNFVGFQVHANSPPGFNSLFAGEAGLVGQPVYRLNSVGAWEPIFDLTSMGPQAGQAYWIRCQAPSTRSGTIELESVSPEGLTFGLETTELSVRIRNTSPVARTVTLKPLVSVAAPPGQPALAGPVPLEYRDVNYATASAEWKPLTNALTFIGLPARAEWTVRLGVRRARLAATAPGATYQGLIEASDDAGTRWLIPVSAHPVAAASARGPIGLNSPGDSSPPAGLWIGDAVINAVSQPAALAEPMEPRAAGGEFTFRLILHVAGDGTAHLMQQVFLVRKPPTYKPDPANPGFNVIDQPSRTVVVTEEKLIPQITGPGTVTGRRVSAAAFGFKDPIPLIETGGQGPRTATIVLDYDDPLNPFKHLYHPDHNNLDERFEGKLPEGRESFTVTRAVELDFTTADPLGLDPPGWGDTEIGGVYRETIGGLHRSAIRIRGSFRLVRVTPVAELNDDLATGLSGAVSATRQGTP